MNSTLRKISFLLFCLSSYLPAFSQDFEVAPVDLAFTVDPGGIETKKITVRNHSNKTQTFTLTMNDVKRDSLGNKQKTAIGNNKRSCAQWMNLNPSFFDLRPNEEKDISVVMQVPSDGFSTRWTMIYVQAAQEQNSVSHADKTVAAGIIITPRIGVKVTQSPKSNVNYKANIQNLHEITVPTDTLRSFEVKVNNLGDKIIDGYVSLVLSNLETAQERKLPPSRVSLLPDESRILTLKLPKDVSKAKYALAAILDYGHGTSLEGVQMSIEVK